MLCQFFQMPCLFALLSLIFTLFFPKRSFQRKNRSFCVENCVFALKTGFVTKTQFPTRKLPFSIRKLLFSRQQLRFQYDKFCFRGKNCILSATTFVFIAKTTFSIRQLLFSLQKLRFQHDNFCFRGKNYVFNTSIFVFVAKTAFSKKINFSTLKTAYSYLKCILKCQIFTQRSINRVGTQVHHLVIRFTVPF